jgi:hypothetical protein
MMTKAQRAKSNFNGVGAKRGGASSVVRPQCFRNF